MSKLIATLAAASILVSMQAPAFASDYGKHVAPATKHSGHKGNAGKALLGFAIGAAVVAAIASQAKADYSKPTYVYRSDADSYRDQCRVWRTDCRYGSERACYKYESKC